MSRKEAIGWSKYLSLEPHNSTEIQLAFLTQIVMSYMGQKTTVKEMLITQHNFEKQGDKTSYASEDEIAKVFSLLATN